MLGPRSSSIDARMAALFAAVPWRTFRWYEGQRHYSGKYWSVTDGDHVIYESRLELSTLLMADFDLAVRRIKAQPFLLTAVVDGRRRRHILDYLLRTDAGPVVVDVVRRERLTNPKIQRLCAWTRRVVESRSWGYEVVSEQPPSLLPRSWPAMRISSGNASRSFGRAAAVFDLITSLSAATLTEIPLIVCAFADPTRPS